MFLLGDLLGYWIHRAFHSRTLWKFHAVHHSSTQLDWLSSARVHPVNDVAAKLIPAMALVGLGFPLKALAAYVPFLTFYAILLHANVGWSFGWLRYVLASPLFHRWHHTTEEQGLSKNFAPLFPVRRPRLRDIPHAAQSATELFRHHRHARAAELPRTAPVSVSRGSLARVLETY